MIRFLLWLDHWSPRARGRWMAPRDYLALMWRRATAFTRRADVYPPKGPRRWLHVEIDDPRPRPWNDCNGGVYEPWKGP